MDRSIQDRLIRRSAISLINAVLFLVLASTASAQGTDKLG